MAVYSLKGIADFLGSDEIVTVHDTVVMPCDARTDIVRRAVYFTTDHALIDGTSTLYSPDSGLYGDFAAEL